LFEILAGVFQSKAHVGIGGKVEHKLAVVHRYRESRQVEGVPPHESEVCVAGGGFEELGLPVEKLS
jgi:hypothetical protein